MNVTYTGKLDVGGSGIGTTAYHQVKPLEEEGLLKIVYASNNSKAPKDKLFRPVPESPGADDYETMDKFFDQYCAENIENPEILQSWGSHCLAQFVRFPKAVKVVNLYSAHIKKQAQLLNGEFGLEIVTKGMIERISKELELADYIFIPSEFVRGSLKEYKLEYKAILVPFGVDLNKFTPIEKSDDVFRVIFSGQNWIRKGLTYLLSAWISLKLSNAELIVTGVPPKVAEDLNNKFGKFGIKAGWVDDIVKAYQSSDVFCLPSLEDGAPLAFYEAVACGLAPIITDHTGTYQHIYNGTNGFIVPIRNPNAIAERIKWLYDDREQCKRMGRNARKYIEAFPWERHEKGYIDFIKRI